MEGAANLDIKSNKKSTNIGTENNFKRESEQETLLPMPAEWFELKNPGFNKAFTKQRSSIEVLQTIPILALNPNL